ncbi:hypothetical protein LDO32_15500 [Luteimonas sp. Y-2-2-4F]|nr:hypothetical protein [Luteimonas sp. Y-2-2-4F]MCD9033132.1 hypothetical protein [Luteimonas sp. Y-2-2-4F]
MRQTACTAYPFRLRWDARQLAEAVPVPLRETDLFAGLGRGAGAAPRAPRGRRPAYAPAPSLPAAFRIHG